MSRRVTLHIQVVIFALVMSVFTTSSLQAQTNSIEELPAPSPVVVQNPSAPVVAPNITSTAQQATGALQGSSILENAPGPIARPTAPPTVAAPQPAPVPQVSNFSQTSPIVPAPVPSTQPQYAQPYQQPRIQAVPTPSTPQTTRTYAYTPDGRIVILNRPTPIPTSQTRVAVPATTGSVRVTVSPTPRVTLRPGMRVGLPAPPITPIGLIPPVPRIVVPIAPVFPAGPVVGVGIAPVRPGIAPPIRPRFRRR